MLQRPDPTSLHVITENGEQCFVWRHNQLTYIAQDKQELPLVFGQKFGKIATKLDLSYNTLTSYQNINLFTNLNELILDNNCLEDDHLDFKQNLRLKILSLNKNKLADLHRLISTIKVCFPNLEFLSLIGNPLCPSPISASFTEERQATAGESTESYQIGNQISGETQQVVGSARPNGFSASAETAIRLAEEAESNEFALQKYRYFIIYHLPNLRFLDSNPITDQERDEALKRCCWMESSGLGANTSTSHQRAGLVASQVRAQNGNHANGIGAARVQLTSPAVAAAAGSGQQPAEGYRLESVRRAAPNNSLEPRGAFSRLSYKYTGRNSEGNRFIRDNHL